MEGSVAPGPGAAVGVVVAAEGYPDAPISGRPLGGVEPASASDDGDVLVFHAGTRQAAGGVEASGGRIATVVGRGPDLAGAREAAYRGVGEVTLEGAQFRTDIALRELGAATAAETD